MTVKSSPLWCGSAAACASEVAAWRACAARAAASLAEASSCAVAASLAAGRGLLLLRLASPLVSQLVLEPVALLRPLFGLLLLLPILRLFAPSLLLRLWADQREATM